MRTPAAPPRVPAPPLPRVTLSPEPGRAVWTCREGFEAHLFEELAWAKARPRLLGAALVESDPDARWFSGRPPAGCHARVLDPSFARLGFRLVRTFSRLQLASQARVHAESLLEHTEDAPLHLQGWALDTTHANPLSGEAATLTRALEEALPRERLLATPELARERGGLLVQLCLAGGDLGLLGLVPAREALSLAPGGRQRMRRAADDPSRAALKLEEALESLGVPPGRGDLCVDLGAAPGGWTQRLVERGARVIAVDPALLREPLRRHPKVTHVQDSAFRYEPDEPVDWLFCDMAWRPLEVAALLAKWGRRGWADALVANIKLPMKDKNPVLFRVRRLLEEDGGWKGLRMRQLYHDRDEVTVSARRL